MAAVKRRKRFEIRRQEVPRIPRKSFKSGGESVSRTDVSTEEVQRFAEVFLKFPKSALILRPVRVATDVPEHFVSH